MNRLPLFSLFLAGLLAGLALWYATPAGIGLTNDSVAYIGGARSIVAGTGYSDIWLDSELEPITHYPPLFPLTLSGFALLGLDPLRGARVLNILLFAINTALMGVLGWRLAASASPNSISRWPRWGGAVLLILLFGLNAPIFRVHAFALSEPLYLFFSLLAFLLFDWAVGRSSSRALLLVGLSVGLACLTRYSGLALAAAFVVCIFLFAERWQARVGRVGWFLAGMIPPLAAWFLRNRLIAGNATNRVFQYHPIEWSNLEFGLFNISQFLVPVEPWRRDLLRSGWLPWLLLALGLILLVWLLRAAWKLLVAPGQPAGKLVTPLFFSSVLYAFAYLGAILFSMSFFDASTKFQHRILSPLYLAWMILLLGFAAYLFHQYAARPATVRLWAVGLLVFFSVPLGFSVYDFQSTISELRSADGLGYGSWKWRDSRVMAKLKALPPDIIIYTNTPPAVYFVIIRPSRVIPTLLDPVDNLPRSDYEQNLEQMRADLESGRAVLALFDTAGIENALGPENFAGLIANLGVLEKSQSDVLYGQP